MSGEYFFLLFASFLRFLFYVFCLSVSLTLCRRLAEVVLKPGTVKVRCGFFFSLLVFDGVVVWVASR